MASVTASTPTSSASEIQRVTVGGGRITLGVHGVKAVFEELSAAYPLKLLSPQVHERAVAIVYVLSYGGGLVAGDRVELDVELKDGSKLLVLSQGSTKVFKTRPGQRLAAIRPTEYTPPLTPSDDSLTTQTIRYTIQPKSCLFLLPDPVTCFRSASYNQIQKFNIAPDASVVILDWLTSGRKALDEDWAFTRYYSENEVFISGKRWARDVMLLEADESQLDSSSFGSLPRRTLGEKLSPYSCYAMVLLYGTEVQNLIENLRASFEAITVFKRRVPEDLIWSFSPVGIPGTNGPAGGGAVVRLAGKETEQVKRWLKEELRGLEDVMGVDVYRRTFR